MLTSIAVSIHARTDVEKLENRFSYSVIIKLFRSVERIYNSKSSDVRMIIFSSNWKYPVHYPTFRVEFLVRVASEIL